MNAFPPLMLGLPTGQKPGFLLASLPSCLPYWEIGVTGLVVTLFLVFLVRFLLGYLIFKRGRPTRTFGGTVPATSAYIECKADAELGTSLCSCSFIEFDGRGDFLDFDQMEQAWKKARELADEAQKLEGKVFLVIYCHGWKNNAHSGDVVSFVHFLTQLAAARAKHGERVHGVYLAWSGNPYKPYVDLAEQKFIDTRKLFGGPVVDEQRSRRTSGILMGSVLENITYWGRKRAAESDVSGVPMARAILSLCFACKRAAPEGNVKTMLMGHSFGALIMERCMGQASLSAISESLSWFDEKTHPTTVNPLPVDLFLFVNSASPSIHAKQLKDFLAQHASAIRNTTGITEEKDMPPVVISVTSTADWATRAIHPIGNCLSHLSGSMMRTYDVKWSDCLGSVWQWYFYKRTPGHNPLLVTRWVEKVPKSTPPPPPTDANNEQCTSFLADESFSISKDVPANQKEWVQFAPRCGSGRWNALRNMFSSTFFRGEVPWRPAVCPDVVKALDLSKSSTYWIMRCNRDIIPGHTEIWTDDAINLYAALFDLVAAKIAVVRPLHVKRHGAGPLPESRDSTEVSNA